MEQVNTADSRAVACVKIGVRDQDYFIPIDEIEGVRMNPRLVRVPEAPDGVIGLFLGEKGPVPYICLGDSDMCEDEAGWHCGIEIKNADGQILGILCTRIEENVEAPPELLAQQAALWREWNSDQA